MNNPLATATGGLSVPSSSGKCVWLGRGEHLLLGQVLLEALYVPDCFLFWECGRDIASPYLTLVLRPFYSVRHSIKPPLVFGILRQVPDRIASFRVRRNDQTHENEQKK